MGASEPRENVLKRKVAGEYNTFRVYLHLMKVKRATAREVYRALGMSSASLAFLHLENLVRLGLAKKDSFGYQITSPRRFGILRFFYLLGKWFVPRTFFYFLFFTCMTIVFIHFSNENQSLLVPAVVALLSALVNLYETIAFYRLIS